MENPKVLFTGAEVIETPKPPAKDLHLQRVEETFSI